MEMSNWLRDSFALLCDAYAFMFSFYRTGPAGSLSSLWIEVCVVLDNLYALRYSQTRVGIREATDLV